MSNNIADRENREELRAIKSALDRLEGGSTFDISPSVDSSQWAQCDEAEDKWYIDPDTQEVKECTPPKNAPPDAEYTCTNAENTQLLSDCAVGKFKSEGDSLCVYNQYIHND